MKNKWIRKAVAFAAAAVMSIGCMSMSVGASGTETAEPTITDLTNDSDYWEKQGVTGTATINITKYQYDVDADKPGTGAKPIEGVEFGIANVGKIVQYTIGTESGLAYGIKKDVFEKAGVTFEADFEKDGYLYVKDYLKINEALRDVSPDKLVDYVKPNEQATNDEGMVTWPNSENENKLDYGLYLVVETDVSGAKVDGESITITKRQYPYVVSAPIYDGEKWSATIDANAKNETGTASLEKKIVTGYDGTLGPIQNEDLKDSDVTNIGDTVEFKLTSEVIKLEKGAKLESYKLQDQVSAGLTLPTTWSNENIKVVDVKKENGTEFIFGTDYTVTTDSKLVFDGEQPSITAGGRFEVTFTATGLAKLTEIATDTDENRTDAERQIAVYYTATVNENAVEGEPGNTNEARLVFKVEGNSEITTNWDKVTEYIFSMGVNKLFDGKQDLTKIEDVKFTLGFYKKDATELTPLYVTGSNGVYTCANAGTTELALDANGKLSIKGVPTGVELYLTETETAAGFNLLKEPIKLQLVAAETDDKYTGYLDPAKTTVNGEIVDSLGNEATKVSVTVNNTSGFQLPSTGGMGAWIFAIVSVLVLAAGITFFVRTKPNKN